MPMTMTHYSTQTNPCANPLAGPQAAANGGGFIADSDDEVQPAPVTGRAGRRRTLGVSQRSGLPLNSQGGTSQLTAKSWGAPQ